MNYMEFKQELSDFVLCGIGSSRQGNLKQARNNNVLNSVVNYIFENARHVGQLFVIHGYMKYCQKTFCNFNIYLVR